MPVVGGGLSEAHALNAALLGDPAQAVRAARRRAIAPDPQLTVSQWADEHRMLSTKASAEPGRWRTERTPYLREPMDCLSASSPIETVVMMFGAQVGKALSLDTPIATPSGWTTMGEIKPGDLVFSERGERTRVIGVSPVMHDRACRMVTFSDGSRIVADEAHLWEVERYHRGRPTGRAVLTTADIGANPRVGNRCRYAVPVASPLELPDQPLPIDPYALGVWLGDGNSASNQITAHDDDAEELAGYLRASGLNVVVRKPKWSKGKATNLLIDPYVRSETHCIRNHELAIVGRYKITKRGKPDWICAECARQTSNGYQRGTSVDPVAARRPRFGELLSALNLRANKHIPAQYLRASALQRLALLQGLMDTDGSIGLRGTAEITFVSPALVEGTFELLCSLGLKPTVRPLPKVNATRITFRAYVEHAVFRLRRKCDRLPCRSDGRPGETGMRRIVAVDRADSVPVRCIMVDSPSHLFLAGRSMIPTHNTESGLNFIGYAIHHVPGPVMLVQPTLDMAKRLSKQRLASMIEDTPALRARVADPRSRDSGNTQLMKEFPGGVLILAGANSAAGLRSMPVRYLFLDEIDAYPQDVDDEGDPIALAEKRTTTFARRKILKTSTPTDHESSRIERDFDRSDMRRFFVPCPHCGHMQWLRWRGVNDDAHDSRANQYRLVWIDELHTRAGYSCAECGVIIEEKHKTQMLAFGRWQATAPEDGRTRGYHLSSLYSPIGWMSWAQILREFEDAAHNVTKLKTFVNTRLAETWKEATSVRIDASGLANRAENYQLLTVPEGGLVVTAGIDVQDNRIEVVQRAWGEGEESWLVNHAVIFGDPSRTDLWAQVLDVIDTPLRHASGGEIKTLAAAVDTGGHYTHEVYAWARQHKRRHVIAIKGASTPGKIALGKPSRQDINVRNQTIKRGVDLWPIGTDTIKALIYGRIRNLSEPGPGAYHWPIGLPADYWQQLTAERQSSKIVNGFVRRFWVKPDGVPNEALDCEVYAYAALQYAYTRFNRATFWQQMKRRIGAAPKDQQAPVEEATHTPEPSAAPAISDGRIRLDGWRRR